MTFKIKEGWEHRCGFCGCEIDGDENPCCCTCPFGSDPYPIGWLVKHDKASVFSPEGCIVPGSEELDVEWLPKNDKQA